MALSGLRMGSVGQVGDSRAFCPDALSLALFETWGLAAPAAGGLTSCLKARNLAPEQCVAENGREGFSVMVSFFVFHRA